MDIGTSQPTGTTHPSQHPGEALLLALNAAATSLQRSIQCEEEVFRAFSDQVIRLELRGGISLLDESGANLVFKVVAYQNPILKALTQVEKFLGIQAKGYSVPVDRVDAYRQVIRNGKAVFIPDTKDISLQVMPDGIQALAKPLLSVLGNPPGIFAPLIVDGNVKGMC